MKKYQKCISKIQASLAAGKISAAQAQALLTAVNAQVTQLGAQRAAAASAKHSAQLNQSLQSIAGAFNNSQTFAKEFAKRQSLLNIKKFRAVVNFVMGDTKRLPGKGMELYMTRAHNGMVQLGRDFSAKLVNRLDADGVMEFVRKASRQDNLDWWKEVWNLSQATPVAGGVTGNVKAQKVAAHFMAINDELLAMTNRNGGNVNRAEGRIVYQTHDAHKLRRAGIEGFWGVASWKKSFEAWRDDVLRLNPDWDRMGIGPDPAEREKYLREFHKNIYSMNHAKEGSMDSLYNTEAGGSTASKASAERSLWFRDADSAFSYHEKYGSGDGLGDAMLGQIKDATRTIGLMQNFGPDSEKVFNSAMGYLGERSKHFDDSVARLKSLQAVPNMWEEVTGRSRLSDRPTVTAFVNSLKNLALLSKAPFLVGAVIPDSPMMGTSLRYRGVRAMERAEAHLRSVMFRSPDEKRLSRDLTLASEAYAGGVSSSWISDENRGAWGSKAVEKLYGLTGFNKRNEIMRSAASLTYAVHIADDAGKAFDQLSPEVQRDLGDFGLGKAEWDVWRKYTESFQDSKGKTHTGLFANAIDKFTDSDLDSIVAAKGDSLTTPNRERMRDTLRANLRSIFHEVSADATTEPSLRGQAFMHQGSHRGGWAREVGELFWLLKGYGVNSMFRTVERERARTGTTSFREWATEHGTSGAANLIAQVATTTLAGYLTVALADIRKGQEPRTPVDKDWNAVLFEAMSRGGGLGMLGDFMFNDYDKRYRSASDALLGPVLGEASTVFDIASDVRKAGFLEGKERADAIRSLGYSATKFASQNLPLVNLPVLKQAMDNLLWYQMSEAFSPGLARRRAAFLEKQNRGYLYPAADPRNAIANDRLHVQDAVETALDYLE